MKRSALILPAESVANGAEIRSRLVKDIPAPGRVGGARLEALVPVWIMTRTASALIITVRKCWVMILSPACSFALMIRIVCHFHSYVLAIKAIERSVI